MSIELKVPTVGESITEVQIGEWLKREGDIARKDENLVEIETDKATVELPAPVEGRITKLLKAAGERAAVGEVIGYMEAVAGAAAGGSAAPTGSAAPAAAHSAPAAGAARADAPRVDAPVMPSARREMAQRGLGPHEVVGSGAGGRIHKEDVLRHGSPAPAASSGAVATAPSAPAPAVATRPVAPAALVLDERHEEVVPMTPLRRRIAERLVEAQHTAALLTTFNEVDMSGVMALRAEHREAFQKKYNVKLGFMSFFVKATVEALKGIPQLNAELRDSNIVYRNHYDIGIAVSSPKGLVVPIVRGAERLGFADVELMIEDFGRRAQENKIALDELVGGTFTISNGGIFGSLFSTPIVNPPQSGILGLHSIQERPVVRDGQIVIRPMMYMALTYDHRIVDGREAVTFLRRIKEAIEQPARILLEV